MNSIQLTPVEERSPGIAEVSPVLLPDPNGRYLARATRLRQLAVNHPMANYLEFVARIVETQHALLNESPLPDDLVMRLGESLGTGHAPLAGAIFSSGRYWQHLLRQMTDRLYPEMNTLVRLTLDVLRDYDEHELEKIARSLLTGDYDQVDSGQAIFVWAALSLYFRQLAAKLSAAGKASLGEQRQYCPVCASSPTASIIMTGPQSGLRYLQCGLCESRWHMVRVKCSNCEQTGQMDYWSLDEHNTVIKAESCGDCSTYLKVLYPEYDREAELVADDLASLALDVEVERQGFARSGLNPFLFPGR